MEHFIQPEDYNPQIRSQILGVITQNDNDTLHTAELAAQEEMESYLRMRYNTGSIFSLNQDPTGRSRQIVMYLVDMALYHLHSNITPDNVPEIRYLRYNRAKEWLKMVADGKLSPDLPELETPFINGGSQFFEGGSNEKVTERY